MKRNAFTLIELLVVIAIIAILASILFPVFAQAREKARQAVCISNTNQMGLAFMMYVQDYDEHYPTWAWGNSSDVGGCGSNPGCGHFESLWMNAVFPYVKSAGVYACPSSNDHSTLFQNGAWAWTNHRTNAADMVAHGFAAQLVNNPVNYGMSEPLEQGYLCNSNTGCSEAALTNVAGTLMVADCETGLTADGFPDPNNPNDPNWGYVIERVAYPNTPANCWSNTATCGATLGGGFNPGTNPALAATLDSQARHSEGDVIDFADGHSKWLRDSSITRNLLNGASR